MLSQSSIQGEYFFGDLPGTLQYEKRPEDILALSLPDDSNTRDYVFAEHSVENKLRACIRSSSKITNTDEWKTLLVMERVIDGQKWHKVALQNRESGSIALMTSTNTKEYLTNDGHLAAQSRDPDWWVGRFRMCAPVIFWRELQNRIRN